MKLASNTQYRYTPDPGTVDHDVFCGVCGTKTEVTRNVYGPRTYVQAMGGGAEYFDMFLCPHSQDSWHLDAVELRKAADNCVGQWYKGMNYAEADRLIQNAGTETGQKPE